MYRASAAPFGSSERDEVQTMLSKVAASPHFNRSARLREFLLFVCDRAMAGRFDEIHELQIGREVFGRPNYGVTDDNIVRVAASQLRKRLADYYASDGIRDPLVIVLPKGCYVPLFEHRTLPQPPPEGAPQTAAPLPPAAMIATAPVGRWERLSPWMQRALLAVAIATCGWMWRENRTNRDAAATVPANIIWNQLMTPSRRAVLVVADSCLALLQDMAHQRVSLADYSRHDYLSSLTGSTGDERVKEALRLVAGRQYTSLGDLNLARKLSSAAAGAGEISVRYARDLTLRDLKADSLILLGSHRSNPWVELFEARMNFRFGVTEEDLTAYFGNQVPLPGEPSRFVSMRGAVGEGYSVVALLPNLTGTGKVLLIEGTTMEATEAAGELLTDDKFSSLLEKRSGWRRNGPPRYFEAVIRSRSIGSAAANPELVAYRDITDTVLRPVP
ncbi:MAG: hypothetical protein ABI806_25745 [Candidatus Solibacter sp.]